MTPPSCAIDAAALPRSIDLVALDVDGTLLTPDHRVEPAVRAAIAGAQARGVRVILASSRGPKPLEAVQTDLGLAGEWFAAFQGAVVARRAAEGLEVLVDVPMPGPTARSIEKRATALGLSVGHYTGWRWRVPLLTNAIRRAARITGEVPVPSTTDELDAEDPPYKVLLIADDEHEVSMLHEIARSLPDEVNGAFSHHDHLEITAAGVDKGTAVAAVRTHLRIERGRTAAVGDGHNDLPLFAAVGRPIAMGQAPAQVRATASWVTTTNTDGGVARALAHLGLAGTTQHGTRRTASRRMT